MNFINNYWKPILWSVIITLLCLLPRSVEPQTSWLSHIPYFDKIVHLGLYAILGFLWYLSAKQKHSFLFFMLIFLYSFALGGAIELLQPFLGRSKELMDLIADLFGCLIGILSYIIVTHIAFLPQINSKP